MKRSSSRRLSVERRGRRAAGRGRRRSISSRMPPPALGGRLQRQLAQERRRRARAPRRRPAAAPHPCAENAAIGALPVGEAVGHQQIAALVHRPEVGDRPLDDPQAMARQLEIADDVRIEQAHGVGGDRVAKARMELLGHRRAADDCILLEHDDAQARAGQIGGAGEPVVAAADDGDVVEPRGSCPLCAMKTRRRAIASRCAPSELNALRGALRC